MQSILRTARDRLFESVGSLLRQGYGGQGGKEDLTRSREDTKEEQRGLRDVESDVADILARSR
jgi:hypothetical protein